MLRVAFMLAVMQVSVIAEDDPLYEEDPLPPDEDPVIQMFNQEKAERDQEESHLQSWWYEAQEEEFTAFEANGGGNGSPGPISDMLDNFGIYMAHMLEEGEVEEVEGVAPEDAVPTLSPKQEKFVKAIHAKYSSVDFSKPVGGDQGYTSSVASRTHEHLDNMFFTSKDKKVATDMLEFLETLAPDVVAQVRAEREAEELNAHQEL